MPHDLGMRSSSQSTRDLERLAEPGYRQNQTAGATGARRVLSLPISTAARGSALASTTSAPGSPGSPATPSTTRSASTGLAPTAAAAGTARPAAPAPAPAAWPTTTATRLPATAGPAATAARLPAAASTPAAGPTGPAAATAPTAWPAAATRALATATAFFIPASATASASRSTAAFLPRTGRLRKVTRAGEFPVAVLSHGATPLTGELMPVPQLRPDAAAFSSTSLAAQR